MLLGLESGIGRGTGRATGGGGGSKKEPGILLWPLPFGCRQYKKGQGGDMRQSADTGWKKKKEGGSWEAEPQKISMTKGGVMVKVRKRRWWSTNSKKMRYVDDVVHGGVENNNHHKG